MGDAFFKIPRSCGHNLLITPEHCSICALEDEVKALQLELADEQGAYDSLKEMFDAMTDCGDCQSVAKIKARAEAAESLLRMWIAVTWSSHSEHPLYQETQAFLATKDSPK